MALTYDSIATTTLGSGNTTITFNSIPQTYTDLRITVYIPSVTTAGSTTNLWVNNNAVNISETWMYFTPGANGKIAGRASNTFARFQGNVGIPNTSTANYLTADIFSYANTSIFKPVIFQFSESALGASNGNLGFAQGSFLSTNAITSLDINYSGTMGVGTTATLYGIKRA